MSLVRTQSDSFIIVICSPLELNWEGKMFVTCFVDFQLNLTSALNNYVAIFALEVPEK